MNSPAAQITQTAAPSQPPGGQRPNGPFRFDQRPANDSFTVPTRNPLTARLARRLSGIDALLVRIGEAYTKNFLSFEERYALEGIVAEADTYLTGLQAKVYSQTPQRALLIVKSSRHSGRNRFVQGQRHGRQGVPNQPAGGKPMLSLSRAAAVPAPGAPVEQVRNSTPPAETGGAKTKLAQSAGKKPPAVLTVKPTSSSGTDLSLDPPAP